MPAEVLTSFNLIRTEKQVAKEDFGFGRKNGDAHAVFVGLERGARQVVGLFVVVVAKRVLGQDDL